MQEKSHLYAASKWNAARQSGGIAQRNGENHRKRNSTSGLNVELILMAYQATSKWQKLVCAYGLQRASKVAHDVG